MKREWKNWRVALALAFCLAMFASAAFGGETVTVNDVTSLTNQLDRLNRQNTADRKDHGDVIIMEPGNYDVSGCHMECDAAGALQYLWSTSHLAIAYVTLKGKTDNPRDVVIYGNKTDRILYMFLGKLQNVTISNGYQKVGDIGGGGVAARNQASLISNVVVTSCSSKQKGGGVYYTKCHDCTVEKCYSSANGGGVYYCDNFRRGRIVNNESASSGGGASNARLDGTYVANNVAAASGGGIAYNYDDKTSSTNCTIVGNTAKTGGGVGDSARIYDSVISNNVAVLGGGIAECTAYGCKILHNLARASGSDNYPKGGGCYAKDKVCSVYDSVVAGNACIIEGSTARTGGAGQKTNFYRCEIFNNFCPVGASLNEGFAEDCVISNNVSPTYMHNLRLTSRLTRCKVYKDSMTSPGAVTDSVIRDYDGTWTLAPGENVYTNGTFTNTNPGNENYKLFINNASGVFSLTNCLIFGNRAYSILAKDKAGEPVNVVNCTIVGNTNVCMFGGFRADQDVAVLYLKNTIICGNRQMSDPTKDWNFYPRYGSDKETLVSIENCMIGPGWLDGQTFQSCSGLISSNDPKFLLHRDAAHPYALRLNSPAIGKGTVEAWMEGAYDIRCAIDDGEYPRLRDGKVDLGCYQCWLDPTGIVVSFR